MKENKRALDKLRSADTSPPIMEIENENLEQDGEIKNDSSSIATEENIIDDEQVAPNDIISEKEQEDA